jgi:hypothetical protein
VRLTPFPNSHQPRTRIRGVPPHGPKKGRATRTLHARAGAERTCSQGWRREQLNDVPISIRRRPAGIVVSGREDLAADSRCLVV